MDLFEYTYIGFGPRTHAKPFAWLLADERHGRLIERRWRTSMKEETQWVVFMEASTKRGRRSSVCLVLQTRVCRMLENSKHQAYPTNDLTIMATVY